MSEVPLYRFHAVSPDAVRVPLAVRRDARDNYPESTTGTVVPVLGEQKMLEGHQPGVTCHQVYLYTKVVNSRTLVTLNRMLIALRERGFPFPGQSGLVRFCLRRVSELLLQLTCLAAPRRHPLDVVISFIPDPKPQTLNPEP
jgi:hypothetical protein